jgi:glycosyltransferase involved in cell wall biosynthesis
MLVRREAEALCSIGFDVDVFCLRGDQPAEEAVDGIRVHRQPLRRNKQGAARNLFEYMAFFFLTAFSLTVAHLHRPFTVIQVNTMPDFLVFATLIPRLLGARVILQMYEPMPELWATRFRSSLTTALIRHIQQWSLRYAYAAFTVTQPLKDNLVSHGADPRKITVVLNAPDTHLFGTIPPRSTLSDGDSFTLICHGAIEERYGHDTMLQAVAALRSSIPGLRLRVTGDGSYQAEFLAQVQTLGLQNQVQYLGFVSLAQLAAELSRADVGMVAQKASPYSHLVHTGKMYDYLAFGKPVIVSRLRAVQTYFDEDSLCFFAPGDPNDLARAILELFQQPGKRRTLVENSQKLYSQYKWEKQKEVYLSVYRGFLG